MELRSYNQCLLASGFVQFPLLEYEGTLVRFEVRDKDLLGSEDLGRFVGTDS